MDNEAVTEAGFEQEASGQEVLAKETETSVPQTGAPKRNPVLRVLGHIKRYWQIYLMLVPGFVILFIFSYIPLYGITLTWRQYKPNLGILHSPWVGWENFAYVFSNNGFFRLVRNTLFLGLLNIIFAFPSSIILALMINEVRLKWFKKTVQTISYIPYFISWVVISGMAYLIFARDYGLLNAFLKALGIDPVYWYGESGWWPWILTFVGIWKSVGWGTIVFLAGMSSINMELYEAAYVDGAGRWKQMWHVTLPGLMPVIAMTFILTVANIVKDDFEKIYALVGGNSMLFETADTLGTWAYRSMQGGFRNYGDVTAVTTLQGIIGFILMAGANWLVRKSDSQSLW